MGWFSRPRAVHPLQVGIFLSEWIHKDLSERKTTAHLREVLESDAVVTTGRECFDDRKWILATTPRC